MMNRIDVVAELVDQSLSVRIVEDFRLEVRIQTSNLTALDALRQLLGAKRKAERRRGSFRWRCQDAADLLYLFREVYPYVGTKKVLVGACIEFLTCDEPLRLYRLADRVRRFGRC